MIGDVFVAPMIAANCGGGEATEGSEDGTPGPIGPGRALVAISYPALRVPLSFESLKGAGVSPSLALSEPRNPRTA
jgi:hypothetical protein